MPGAVVTDNLETHFQSARTGASPRQVTVVADREAGSESSVKRLLKSAAVVTTQAPSYYHPLYEPTNLQLPTKLREINQWSRYFFRTDPLVNNAVKLHAEFPITGFRNICEDPKIQAFYDRLAYDVLKLPKFLSFFSLEYQKLGNVFPFGIWDDSKGHWGRFITLNPDYVEVEQSLFSENPVLRLDPDDALKKIVQTKKPRDLYDKLDPKVIQYVMRGQKVPLSNFVIEVSGSDKVEDRVEISQVSHIAANTSMYEAYGLPPFFSCFKALMYKDILRRAQFSIARRHWKPVKIVKVGDQDHYADASTLNSVRDALNEASQDPDSWFIWHNYISMEYAASAGHVMPLGEEYKWVNGELYAGLGVNEAILTGGGVTFSNASVALRILINKYMRFQKLLSDWITETIYKPVARVQQFYKINKQTGEQELMYPKIEWEMMRLNDDAQMKNLLQQLATKGLISKRTFLSYVGLDPEREKALIKEERENELYEAKEYKKQQKDKALDGKKPPKDSGMGAGPDLGMDLGEGGGGGGIPGPGEEMPMGGGDIGSIMPPEAGEAP